MLGDQPLGSLAVQALDRRLASCGDLAGDVVLVPAANPPALEQASRENPDDLVLTRRFPGDRSGFLTDQLAAALLDEVVRGADCIIDLHSGSPTMALAYTYDYGDRALSASFGYLPVVLGHTAAGQLGLLAAELGIGFLLPEFGGGPLDDVTVGVEGTLNVLRFRGQLVGEPTGPDTVPLVERKQLFRASTHGVLVHAQARAAEVGSPVAAGELGRVVDVATGETVERFDIVDGAILLMARTTPIMVRPGDFAFMTGRVTGHLPVGGGPL
jgi:predicted deacylase